MSVSPSNEMFKENWKGRSIFRNEVIIRRKGMKYT